MGIVYKITCNLTGECYIGSTEQSLIKRITNHRNPSTNVYYSKQIIDRGDYSIDILETNKLDGIELKKIEQHYLDTIDNINKYRAYRTDNQRIEQSRNCSSNYYKNHKKELIKKNADRRKEKYLYTVECECGTSYQKRSEARHLRTKTHTDYVLFSTR